MELQPLMLPIQELVSELVSANGTTTNPKKPVIPHTKIGKMDCLFLLPILAGISLVILVSQTLGPRFVRFCYRKAAQWRDYQIVLPEDEEPPAPTAPKTYMPSEGLAKDLKVHVKSIGMVQYLFDLLRLLVLLTLFALSIYATVVAHAPIAHGHPGKAGIHQLAEGENQIEIAKNKAKKKHRKEKARLEFVTQEWAEFGTLIFYAYNVVLCALLLGLKAQSPIRRVIALHSYVILFLAWCVFAYRDIYPLLTRTLTPVDVLHAPAWLTWTRIAFLTIAAAVLPLLQPQRYMAEGFRDATLLGNSWVSKLRGDKKAPVFLKDFVPSSGSKDIPHVTLTFAQSEDGRIAGIGGKQISLSGPESMKMTHWMRSMHDAILIGVGTAVNDDPRLNVRLLSQELQCHAPQPLILDPRLRMSPTCRLLLALNDETNPHVKTPWLITQRAQEWDQDIKRRRSDLEEAGARIIEVDMVEGHLSLVQLPQILTSLGLKSVMIEGGASIIDQVLSTSIRSDDGATRPLADSVIVTFAPMTLGQDGISYGGGKGLEAIPTNFVLKHEEKFGKDTVLAYRS